MKLLWLTPLVLVAASFGQDQLNVYCSPGNIPVAGVDGPAHLPQRCMRTTFADTPSLNHQVHVKDVAGLTAAFASYTPGDIIMLAPGDYSVSKLSAPNCTAKAWCYIRADVPDSTLPSQFYMLKAPQYYVGKLPRILITSQSGSVFPGQYIRWIAVEITRPAGTGIVYNLVNATGAHDWIFDRMWVHGTPTDETNRGIILNNSYNVSVQDSWFNDFHCFALVGKCGDAETISGGGSTLPDGNFKIVNNHLEASGENILFGGSPGTIAVSDITVAYNELDKPASWNPNDPSYKPAIAYDGLPHPWIVKNCFELKNGTHVLFEGNRCQNNWGGFTQVGAMILLTPKNQAGATQGDNQCPNCAVTDVTVRYNYGSYAGQALQIGCAANTWGAYPAACGNYSVHDNKFDHLQFPTCYKCGSFLVLIGTGNGIVPSGTVSVVNNTFLNDGWLTPATDPNATTANGVLNVQSPPGGSKSPVIFNSNAFDPGNYGIYSTGGGTTNCWTAGGTLKARVALCWPGGSFTGNTFLPSSQVFKGNLPWPDGNGVVGGGANMTLVNAAQAKRK